MAIGKISARQLRALMPDGDPYKGEDIASLIEGLAVEFDRMNATVDDLFDDFMPDTTTSLLERWEKIAGIDGSGFTTNPRRNNVLSRVSARGGASKAYFIEVAQKLGYLVEIVEHHEAKAGRMVAGDAITNGEWVFAFSVKSSDLPIDYAEIGDPVGTPIASWGNLQLIDLFATLKPAHTYAIFTYQQTFFVAGDRAGRRLNQIS